MLRLPYVGNLIILLSVYVVPTARMAGWRSVPLGVSIVAIWPWFLWQARVAGGGADNS